MKKRMQNLGKELVKLAKSAKLAWIVSLFCIVTLWNACGSSFEEPCTGEECGASDQPSSASEVNIYGGAARGGSGSANTPGYNELNQSFGYVPNPFASSDGPSSGTQPSGGVTTSSGGGGTTDTGTGTGTTTFEIPIGIMAEPIDINVEEGDNFSLTFIAMGKAPIKYKWFYRKNTTDTWTALGSGGVNHTIYYARNVLIADNYGYYKAEAEDDLGRKVNSRAALVHIKPGRKPCPGGKYGYNSTREGYNARIHGSQYDYLIPENMQQYRYRQAPWQVEMPSALDAHIRAVSCSHKMWGGCSTWWNSNMYNGIMFSGGGGLLYQCQNQKWMLIADRCYCDDGGGG